MIREIYRGNGFIITTNDTGEVFVANEISPHQTLRISSMPKSMIVSYGNTNLEVVPAGMKIFEFFERR